MLTWYLYNIHQNAIRTSTSKNADDFTSSMSWEKKQTKQAGLSHITHALSYTKTVAPFEGGFFTTPAPMTLPRAH